MDKCWDGRCSEETMLGEGEGGKRTDLSLDEKTGESLRINGGKMVPGRKKGGRKSHGVPVVSKGQEKACAAPSAGRKGPAGRQGL